MADQLFDDYGVGTGSRNLFGGGMSKQELDKLLGLYPLSQANPMSAQDVPTAEAISTVGVPYRGALDTSAQTVDSFQPESIFTQRPMDLSAFMPSDLRNNEMQTQDPREYFTSGQQPQQSSIVQGMFPEVDAMQRALYDQQRQQAMQAQAMQYAQLDPMARAQYSLYLGGQQLGGAIGGALGAKDPQLQMIGLQHQILRELDPSDPAQQLRVARKYAQAAPELAMKIADNALSSQVKIAQINREHKAAIGVPLQVSDRINELNQKMRMLPPDSVEYKDAEEEKARLMKPEKPEPRIPVGTDREAVSMEVYNKNYGDLSQVERAAVNKRVETEAAAKAPKIQVDLKDPTAVAKASLDVMNKWENFIKQDVEVANRFKALQSSISLAQGGNPSADGATIFNIGKIYDPSGAVQEGDKNTILGNPSIPQKIKGYAQRVFEGGSLTPEQRVDLLRIGNELIKGRQSQLNTYRKQYVNKNKALGGDESDILNPYEGLLKIDSGAAVQQIPTQRSGKSAKSWNDLN